MKRYLLLILLISIVFISGCIGQTTTKTKSTNGLVISDFSFGVDSIVSGETIDLDMEIENVGDAKATQITAELFGPEMAETADSVTWGVTNPDGKGNRKISIGSLDPSDPTTGFVPFWTGSWVLTAPKDLVSDTPYTFNVRLDYRYTTTFTGVLTVMSSDYIRSRPKDERDKLYASGGVSQQVTSGGPLLIEAASGSHFVIKTGEEAGKTKTINFKVTNVGSGFPYSNEPGDYKVRIDSSKGISCTPDETFRLSRGKTGLFTCKFTVPSYVTNKLDITFIINLDYRYYQDSAVDITVTKKL